MSEEVADGADVGMKMRNKWWQFWKKESNKKDKTPPKLGWIMGVLVGGGC